MLSHSDIRQCHSDNFGWWLTDVDGKTSSSSSSNNTHNSPDSTRHTLRRRHSDVLPKTANTSSCITLPQLRTRRTRLGPRRSSSPTLQDGGVESQKNHSPMSYRHGLRDCITIPAHLQPGALLREVTRFRNSPNQFHKNNLAGDSSKYPNPACCQSRLEAEDKLKMSSSSSLEHSGETSYSDCHNNSLQVTNNKYQKDVLQVSNTSYCSTIQKDSTSSLVEDTLNSGSFNKHETSLEHSSYKDNIEISNSNNLQTCQVTYTPNCSQDNLETSFYTIENRPESTSSFTSENSSENSFVIIDNSLETSYSDSIQNSPETTSSDTLQNSLENIPFAIFKNSLDTSSLDTIQNCLENSSSNSNKLSLETSSSDTIQSSMEVFPHNSEHNIENTSFTNFLQQRLESSSSSSMNSNPENLQHCCITTPSRFQETNLLSESSTSRLVSLALAIEHDDSPATRQLEEPRATFLAAASRMDSQLHVLISEAQDMRSMVTTIAQDFKTAESDTIRLTNEAHQFVSDLHDVQFLDDWILLLEGQLERITLRRWPFNVALLPGCKHWTPPSPKEIQTSAGATSQC